MKGTREESGRDGAVLHFPKGEQVKDNTWHYWCCRCGCCSQSGREIYCHISQLALLPNKIWLQKNTFSSLLFQLHVKWTRHKAAIWLWFLSWCHSSCDQSKAFRDTSPWHPCLFSLLLSYLQLHFFFSTTRKQIQSQCLPHKQFLSGLAGGSQQLPLA